MLHSVAEFLFLAVLMLSWYVASTCGPGIIHGVRESAVPVLMWCLVFAYGFGIICGAFGYERISENF